MTWNEIEGRVLRMRRYPFTLDYWAVHPVDRRANVACTPRVWAARLHVLHNLLDMLPRP